MQRVRQNHASITRLINEAHAMRTCSSLTKKNDPRKEMEVMGGSHMRRLHRAATAFVNNLFSAPQFRIGLKSAKENKNNVEAECQWSHSQPR